MITRLEKLGLGALFFNADLTAPLRVFVYQPNTVVPKRLTPGQTRRLLQGYRDSVEPVIVTSRLTGTDLILRTMQGNAAAAGGVLEYLGDASRPAVPKVPAE